jgi:CHASE2 domain-containing sensor protein
LNLHQIRFSGRDAYQLHPVREVFDPDLWHSKYADGEFFEDKLVIVGPSSRAMPDIVATPVAPGMLGRALHLNAIAAALDHEFLFHSPLWLVFVAVIGAGILAWALILWMRRPLASLCCLVIVNETYLVLALLTYNVWGFLPVIPTIAAFLLVGLFGLTVGQLLQRRLTPI